MKTIYADTLFLINFIINYLIMLCCAKVCGIAAKRWRIVLAAAFGGTYSTLALLPALGFLIHPAVKIAFGVAMPMLVFGGQKKLLKIMLVFFAISSAFGGAVFAVSMFSGGGVFLGIYAPITLRVLLISFGVSYALLTLIFKRMMQSKGLKITETVVEFKGKKAAIQALEDTGNTLCDLGTGRPVMVTEIHAVRDLFKGHIVETLSEEELKNPVETFERVTTGGENRFRLIPYNAVGVTGGMLLAFKADRITSEGKQRRETVVAIAPNKIGSDEYSAIISGE